MLLRALEKVALYRGVGVVGEGAAVHPRRATVTHPL